MICPLQIRYLISKSIIKSDENLISVGMQLPTMEAAAWGSTRSLFKTQQLAWSFLCEVLFREIQGSCKRSRFRFRSGIPREQFDSTSLIRQATQAYSRF